jgi:hypothetical protein
MDLYYMLIIVCFLEIGKDDWSWHGTAVKVDFVDWHVSSLAAARDVLFSSSSISLLELVITAIFPQFVYREKK